MSSIIDEDFIGMMDNYYEFRPLSEDEIRMFNADGNSPLWDMCLNNGQDTLNEDTTPIVEPEPSATVGDSASPNPESVDLPSYSPMTPPYSVSPTTIVLSPVAPAAFKSNVGESITLVMSPDSYEVQQDPPKAKRGRKRKSESGEYSAASASKKAKKPKIYEIKMPFEDEEKERKRQLAIKAKKYRDLQKEDMNGMQKQLSIVEAERDELKRKLEALKTGDNNTETDMLKRELENLKNENDELRHQVEAQKKNWQAVANSVIEMMRSSSGF